MERLKCIFCQESFDVVEGKAPVECPHCGTELPDSSFTEEAAAGDDATSAEHVVGEEEPEGPLSTVPTIESASPYERRLVTQLDGSNQLSAALSGGAPTFTQLDDATEQMPALDEEIVAPRRPPDSAFLFTEETQPTLEPKLKLPEQISSPATSEDVLLPAADDLATTSKMAALDDSAADEVHDTLQTGNRDLDLDALASAARPAAGEDLRWRCPSCSSEFRGEVPEHCPACKHELDPEDTLEG